MRVDRGVRGSRDAGGSRTLAERYHLGVSSATVRNDLFRPSRGGLHHQPHTSAGRIPPTRVSGVRRRPARRVLPKRRIPTARSSTSFRSSARELDALMEQTSAALMRLTDCLPSWWPPRCSRRTFQASLISLSNHCALIVVGGGRRAGSQSPDLSLPRRWRPTSFAAVPKTCSTGVRGEVASGVSRGTKPQTLGDASRSARSIRSPTRSLVCLQESDIGRVRRLGISSLMKKSQSSVRLPLCCL